MDYKYANGTRDFKRIDKLNALTNPYTFWEEVEKFTRTLESISTINTWQALAKVRFNELLLENGLTPKDICTKPQISSNAISLIDIEKAIKDARVEQKILDKMLRKLQNKFNEMNLDISIEKGNTNVLGDMINRHIHNGEFSIEELMLEIKTLQD